MSRSKELTKMGFDVVRALSRGHVVDAVRIFLRGVREEALRIEEERIWREIERLERDVRAAQAEERANGKRPEDLN